MSVLFYPLLQFRPLARLAVIAVVYVEISIVLIEVSAVQYESGTLVSVCGCSLKHVLKLRHIVHAARILLIKQRQPVVSVIRNRIVVYQLVLFLFLVPELCKFYVSGLAMLVGRIVGKVDLLSVIPLAVPVILKTYAARSRNNPASFPRRL